MKKAKLVLYGEPGVGKSTFASKAPNPLFLCSDGNFEWLDLPDKNHIQLSSYSEFVKVVNALVKGEYSEFESVVVDLTENFYSWSEKEFTVKNKLEHISEYKSMGAGYALVRDDFFVTISKLISIDKNIIFLSHESVTIVKNRQGTEKYKYGPSSVISQEKLWTKIEGQVRYFLRAYMVPEEYNGKTVKKRYLSINPKENEFGICRGYDELTMPEDIELNWNVFAEVVGLNNTVTTEEHKKEVKSVEEDKKAIKEIKEIITTKEEKETETVEEKFEKSLDEDLHPDDNNEIKTEKNSFDANNITDDDLISWAKEGLNVKDIETKYGFTFTQPLKIKYIKFKMQYK